MDFPVLVSFCKRSSHVRKLYLLVNKKLIFIVFNEAYADVDLVEGTVNIFKKQTVKQKRIKI